MATRRDLKERFVPGGDNERPRRIGGQQQAALWSNLEERPETMGVGQARVLTAANLTAVNLTATHLETLKELKDLTAALAERWRAVSKEELEGHEEVGVVKLTKVDEEVLSTRRQARGVRQARWTW
jgi:hypothetical protein